MLSQIEISYYKTEFGLIKLGLFNDKLCMCDWDFRIGRDKVDARISQYLSAEFILSDNRLFDDIKLQLGDYLKGERFHLEFNTLMIGSNFQKQVWDAVSLIAYGETASYGEVTKKIGKNKGVRSVANAIAANALSLFVPCHRVIGSNDKLIGYSGGVSAKKFLLNLESRYYN